MDAAALKRFQVQPQVADWTGKPLKADGKLGPRTRWALAIADLPRHRRDIVECACSQVGVEEAPLGSNRGVAVDGYLRPTGLSAVPWCAAFVSWVLREVGVLGEDGTRYTASAAQMIRQLRPATHGPLPGDVFGWVNADGTGHCGFVIGDARSATWPDAVLTVEGNSANRVRNCVRPREGLSFGVAPQPMVLVSAAVDADERGVPLVVRSSEGTR